MIRVGLSKGNLLIFGPRQLLSSLLTRRGLLGKWLDYQLLPVEESRQGERRERGTERERGVGGVGVSRDRLNRERERRERERGKKERGERWMIESEEREGG